MNRPNLLGVPAALLALACANPEHVVLDDPAVRASLEARVEVDPSLGSAAAEDLPSTLLADLRPEACERVDQHGYWYVRALTWAPTVRAARRELAAARAAELAAGAPGPVAAQAIQRDLSGDEELLDALAAFDLVGLLGLGPAAAARGAAAAQVGLAQADLEVAAWAAWLDVERALIRWRAAEARGDRLDGLVELASGDLERVRILLDTGRLGTAPATSAESAASELERRRSLARDEGSRARARLSVTTGVDSGAALEGAAPRTAALEVTETEGAWFADDAHLSAHPHLRRARRLFELREQQVREAAARAWPGVSLGPRVGFVDPTQLGGVLRITLPFPSSWEGLLEASIERRDAAIQAYEDQLHALRTAEQDALTRLALAEERSTGASLEAVTGLMDDWRAARAGFRVQRTPVQQWTGALRMLVMRATWDIDDRERAELARVDLLAARGPMASPFLAGGAR
ncbi:MAG: hypothetical protein PVJ89_13370 [Planctomycetota bacterium]|jgi:hypothetical protein